MEQSVRYRTASALWWRAAPAAMAGVRVSYGGMTGWAASRYIAIQTGNGYTTNDNFGSTAAAVGIPLIAGIVIGSAIANSGPAWARPYRGWGGRPNIYNGCIGRNCRSNWGPPRPHWTDPRLARQSGLSSRNFGHGFGHGFGRGPLHASRRAGGKAQRKTGPPDAAFCQEHRRIGKG